MPKREAPWRLMAGTTKVSRSTGYSPRLAPGPRINKAAEWVNRPMYRKPRIYRALRTPDVPRGCEGPCKVQSYEQRHDISLMPGRLSVFLMSHVAVVSPTVLVSVSVSSLYILGKIWMDENIKLKNHTNSVMFWLVRDRRPNGTPMDFGHLFNMFDNEPSTATVKNDLRDRFQVLHRFYAKVTGGQYASNEQALVKRFWKVNNHVVYNNQEAARYENHTENALLLYMACTHASNPVYATLKIRIYFYDSITN
uniref:Capsid protein n=1 Tax=Sida chlorotic vein virus TaxID=1904883 RepID=A0A1D8GV72_9GEMI|nr:coat protein [Sida chlorotic vein virus]